jgi:hypothetical protein
VAASKVEGWRRMVDLKNKMNRLADDLTAALLAVTINEPLEERVLEGVERKEQDVERSLMLKGAPQVLAGEGAEITLWGLENEQTLEESRPIIRNYVYLGDRLSQLRAGDSKSSMAQASQKLAPLLSMLQGKRRSMVKDVERLAAEASLKGQQPVLGILAQVKSAVQELEVKTASGSASLGGPQRINNPYKNETSRRKLESKKQQVEQQIQAIIIDKRNREAAVYARQALEQTGADEGVIQFGAGHTEGLVRELNEQGLSVIVVVPESAGEKSYDELDKQAE